MMWQGLFQALGKEVTLAEAAILIYICSIRGPARVRIDGRKKMVHIAAYPGNRTPMVYDLVSQALDGFTPASSILETNLINPNYIFHPPVVLANLAVIEHTRGDFTFYREGVTPAVGRLIEAVDEERLRVAAALGLSLDPAPIWLQKTYGARGDTIYEALQTTEALEPSRYTHVLKNLEDANFIREDVPFGLGPLVDLGRLAGVPTPATEAIIHLLSVVTGEDHMARALTMEKMGLDGLRADQIVKVFRDGR